MYTYLDGDTDDEHIDHDDHVYVLDLNDDHYAMRITPLTAVRKLHH